jgi:sortase A
MRKRRALRALATLLIVAGALALADAAATLLWQEPLTALYGRVQQERLGDRFDALVRGGAEQRVLSTLGPEERRRALAYEARAAARGARPGDPVARIEAPAIGLRSVVVEGTDPSELRDGPGHYPDTPLPGAPGTVALAGHRTTYGAPFRHLDGLEPGDRITLTMPYGKVAYRVERTRIVAPSATWVTRRVAYDRLVLTACHPLFSAAERIVVFARREA